MAEFSQWHQGTGSRYEARVGEVLWLDRDQYHGRAPVEIRDRVTGEILARVGDVKIIGNFSPTWVNVFGRKLMVEDIVRMNRPIPEELAERQRQAIIDKHSGGRGSPKEWAPLPPKKKGKPMGHSLGATWGVGPFDSDGAAEVLSEAQSGLASVIGSRLEPGSGASNDEVVAAAALLHHLTDEAFGPSGEPGPLDLTNLAHVIGLFALAVAALDKVLDDRSWIEGYPEPHRKHAAVRALRNALEEKAVTQGGQSGR